MLTLYCVHTKAHNIAHYFDSVRQSQRKWNQFSQQNKTITFYCWEKDYGNDKILHFFPITTHNGSIRSNITNYFALLKVHARQYLWELQ